MSKLYEHDGPCGSFYVRAKRDGSDIRVSVWVGRKGPNGPPEVHSWPAHLGVNYAVNATLAEMGHTL